MSIVNGLFSFFFRICRAIIESLYSLAKKELTEEEWVVWQQFIKFALVGCSNTVIVLIVYYAVVLILGEKFYILGQSLGYVAGIANSYFLNSRFVFHAKAVNNQSFIKMCICYGMTYFLQIALLYLQVDVLHLSKFVAPIVAILITTPVNFFLNKIFAFHNT